VVRPVDPGQGLLLRAALEHLAEADPLIALRQRDEAGEITVRLYGEIQKEVIAETLARDHGVGATFGPSHVVHIERPVGVGEATEVVGAPGNPFPATVGVRVGPGGHGSGIGYARELGSLPLAFYRAIEETVHETLSQGPRGWEVTDGVVTLTRVGMTALSTAGDFRRLTPLVLMTALVRAGVVVCEPVEEMGLEIPADTFGPVYGALIQARATIRETVVDGASHRITCEIPTAEVRSVERLLPRLTRGEGAWTSSLARFAPISGEPPTRVRVGPDPLNRAHYLAEVARS
jgi:ribosomal protection tetracycline resistance protein